MTCKEIKDFLDKEAGFDIGMKTRRREHVNFRFVFYYLCFRYGSDSRSYDFVAKVINRNHATAIHGLKEFYNIYEYDKFFREFSNKIEDKIKSISNLKAPKYLRQINDKSLLDIKADYQKYEDKIGELRMKIQTIRTTNYKLRKRINKLKSA